MGGSGFGYNNEASDGTGGAYLSHLHYEIRHNGTPINPMRANGVPIDPQQYVQRPFSEANASFYGVFNLFVPTILSPAPMQQPRSTATAVNTISPIGPQPLPSPSPSPNPGPIPPAPQPNPAPNPSPNPPVIPRPDCDRPDNGC